MKRVGQLAAWVYGGSWRTFAHRAGVALTVASGVLEATQVLAPQFAPITVLLGLVTRLDRARRVLPMFPPEGIVGQAMDPRALADDTPVTKPEPKP